MTSDIENLFILQKWMKFPQCDSYTCSDDWRGDLDIISAASREGLFTTKMARKVAMHVDLRAGCDEFLSPCQTQWRLGWAAADLGRTAGLDLLETAPEAPDTRKLFLAWELPVSFEPLETGRSSAETEAPTWMAGTHTGGPSRCPRKWTLHPSTLPWGPDKAIQTWSVVCWRM